MIRDFVAIRCVRACVAVGGPEMRARATRPARGKGGSPRALHSLFAPLVQLGRLVGYVGRYKISACARPRKAIWSFRPCDSLCGNRMGKAKIELKSLFLGIRACRHICGTKNKNNSSRTRTQGASPSLHALLCRSPVRGKSTAGTQAPRPQTGSAVAVGVGLTPAQSFSLVPFVLTVYFGWFEDELKQPKVP